MSASAGYDLKREEEVKIFVKNLGIEYRFGCYKEKNAEACHLLGDYLDTIEKNRDKAYEVYKQNCDEHSYPQSCYKSGNRILQGDPKKLEDVTLLKQANVYYSKACSQDHKEACHMAGTTGIAITNGEKNRKTLGLEEEYTENVEKLERSCKLECEPGCFALGSFYLEMLNFEKARPPLEKACELLNPYACANLSVMYKNGDGVEQSKEKSNEFRVKAIELFQQLTRDREQILFQQGLPPPGST